MSSYIQKHVMLIIISISILAGLSVLLYNGQNTNRCEAQNTIWNETAELIQTRLNKKVVITDPVNLIAALAIKFQENPNDTTTFSEIIKCWINQGGNINKLFQAGDAYPLFFTAEAYQQIDQELKDQPTTILVAFAGLSTIVATLLKHGALPVVGQANALDTWAEQYIQLQQQNDEESSEELIQMLHNALQLLLSACNKTQQDTFFEKYPQFKDAKNELLKKSS